MCLTYIDLQPNRYDLVYTDITRHEYRHMISKGMYCDPRCQLDKSSNKYISFDTYRVKHTIMNIKKKECNNSLKDKKKYFFLKKASYVCLIKYVIKY